MAEIRNGRELAEALGTAAKSLDPVVELQARGFQFTGEMASLLTKNASRPRHVSQVQPSGDQQCRRATNHCVSQQLLLAYFEHYFNGFTSYIPGTIVDDFKFSYQLATLSEANAIGAAINDFLDAEPRLSSNIDN